MCRKEGSLGCERRKRGIGDLSEIAKVGECG
jgi:hypothetical protein